MYIRALQSRILSTLPIYSRFSTATTKMASSKRRFAPLGQDGTDDAPALKGIVFDMDGTLCK
jgi:hypothetical protein